MAEFDPDTQLRLAEVRLGLDTEQFLKTPVGRYLLGRAEHDAQDAIDRLKTVDAADANAVRKAQGDAILVERFMAWLNDAIMNGRNAEEQLEQGHQDS
jgi:hypothetical protein